MFLLTSLPLSGLDEWQVVEHRPNSETTSGAGFVELSTNVVYGMFATECASGELMCKCQVWDVNPKETSRGRKRAQS